MLNMTVLMGRMTRDPELRMTAGNVPVTSFTLAVDRDVKSRDGSRVTDFVDVSCWRHNAEFVAKYFRKGSIAVAQGRLQSREWTDKDGNKRRSIELVADDVYFGERRPAAKAAEEPAAEDAAANEILML